MNRDLDKRTEAHGPFEERIRALLSSLTDDSDYAGFDTLSLGGVELLSASQDTQSVQYAFTVLPSLCNRGGNLHGGAATTLFDTLTTTALLTTTQTGHWGMLGVSRTLTVTFLRPLPLGTKVVVDCELVAIGKRMANLKGTMKTADGRVCVTCIHDKALLERPKL
jgi:acyl-coenzyme A thioesterase 13